MTALSTLEHAHLPFAAQCEDEVLCLSERTRVVRRRVAGSQAFVVCKQPLGPDAGARLRHELLMLQRLAEVEGVSRISGLASMPHTLVLEDVAGGAAASVPSRPAGWMP